METQILYIVLVINLLILALNIFFLFRLKLLKYLLEHPVVKKVPGNLKLRPIKINRGNTKKSENRSTSSSRSRGDHDNRNRNDRGKNTRSSRGRDGKSAYSRPGNVMNNHAAEEKRNKPEPVAESEAKSKPAKLQSQEVSGNSPEVVPAHQKANTKAPSAEKPAHTPENGSTSQPDNSGQSDGVSVIKHGRRAKVKRIPTFDE
jgi:hypothetical protein